MSFGFANAPTLIQMILFFLQQGMSKSSFVNDITVAAYKSAQVVD